MTPVQTPHIKRRTALLTRATALATALALWPLWNAEAQEPPPADDPTVSPAPVSRPGVLTRPGTPPPAPEPEESPDPEAEAQGQAQPGPEVAPATPGAQQPAPTQPAPGPPVTSPPPTTDPNIRSGPRVLEVQEVAPDIGRIDSNFTEPFDPLDPPSNVTVNIDFNQADLSDVVMWMSALTGRNFIIADTISASKKITIISPRPVSINEAYRAFLAALNMNGLTIVPFGRFFKIVESSTAQRQALEPTRSIGQIPNDDRMVTHIHQLQHVSIATVQGVLDALKSDQGQLVPYEPTNTIILTDTGLSIRRLLDVLAMLDVPSGQDRIHIYQVQHAAASDLRGTLLEIFPPQSSGQQATQTEARPRRTRRAEEEAAAAAAAAPGVGADVSAGSVVISQIIADERTNQLIVLANERSYERILQIIGQLDVPIPGEGQIHVIFLENANASDLASTLQSLTQGIESQREDGGNTRRTARATADAPASSGGTTLSGAVSITADESTNALVIVASLRDFLAIQNVIRQLDRRRQQVYVEAVIMEVTMNRTSGFGVAFNGGALPSIGGEDAPVFGGTVLGDLTSLTLDPSSIMGLAMGIRGPSVPGLGLPSFGAILQAMQTDNDVNVLSTPHILTMDNEEAEIIVGENIPFISGGSGLGGGLDLGSLASLAGAQSGDLGSLLGGLGGGGLGGFGGGFQVQRQDVALTLRITPQINESNFVRLEIEEEVEDVQSIDPILGPRTTTRQARTTVVVQDQQTIVIGGLMRDTTVRDVNKVPFLGDIPIIGYLFRNTVNRDVKTNLLLLLTPYIIRDPSDFGEIFRRKMQEREEFIQYFGRTGAEYVRSVDYARKDGPLQTAFETIRAAVDEDSARRRAFSTPTTEAPLATPTDAPIRIRVETPAP